MTNHIKEIIYNMAIEEHNIWILHNQELMPLYEPDQERLDKIAITGENFKQVTKDLDKPYEETKEEYKKTLITSINVMYNIVIELKLDDILGLSTEELKNALAKSEHERRKSWFEYQPGNEKATFSKDSYEKYWPEEMQTPFSKLSLGLQYWDLEEVRKRFSFIYAACDKRKITPTQEDYFATILNELSLMMEMRNPDTNYNMYNRFEQDLISPGKEKFEKSKNKKTN